MKKIKRPTLTIGIPAYNEEANIGKLLRCLLAQKQETYHLRKIIVVSDGSTDNTGEVVRAVKSEKVRLITDRVRRGQQAAQNSILRTTLSDIVVFIEADTLPECDDTIQQLIDPLIADNHLGMSVGQCIARKPSVLQGRVIYANHIWKSSIISEWRNGINIYSVRGQAMKALSKHFYENLVWPNNVPEDTFVYLKAKESNLGIVRTEKAKAYFNLPSTLGDKVRRNAKYYAGKNSLRRYFSEILL